MPFAPSKTKSRHTESVPTTLTFVGRVLLYDGRGFLALGARMADEVEQQLVHENWVVRGAFFDSDRVPVTFRKGKNQLVLKIQNGGGPWGFSCRLMNE